MKKLLRLHFLTLLFVSLFNFSLYAEVVTSDIFNYTIDFPEMFEIADCSPDERSILFEHERLPVQAVIKIWPENDYSSSQEALNSTLRKIGATGTVTSVKWRNQKCAVTQLEISAATLGTKMCGWGICIPLTSSKNFFIMLSYAPEDKAYDCEQFILSLLDSVMIDRGSFREGGIITQFAFPKAGEQKIQLNLAGKKIITSIDKDDIEANQFVIDREFEVFKLFVNEKCWKEAWQRFYRIIAKDGMGRVKKAAFDISTSLYDDCRKLDPENPDAAMAQLLLTWTQGFNYERKSASEDKADFTNIPATLTGSQGSDCDSRSMLLMLLYKNMNMDSVMFISVDYSHAMNGIYLEGKQGQTYNLDGRDYLFGETTAKNLTFGMIAADMQDRTKWIPVELYD